MDAAATHGPGADVAVAAPAPRAPAPGLHAPLTGSARMFGTIALSAATFMNVLDTSIANVSLPAIAGDLGVSTNQGTWVITSFAVANAIAVPLTGWMSQRFGQVRLFVISIVLFVIASALCGIAPNMATLIAFRTLQGFVAGPMIPLSQALLLSSYPKALAGTAMAFWSMTTLIAPVAGPLLGGWLTDNLSWPFIFYINVPVGVIAAFSVYAIYRERESVTRKLPIDAIGLALLVVWISAFQVMLDLGKENDWFHSSLITLLAVIAAIGFAAFLIWELTEEHPVVDLSLFKRRNFWTGTLATAVGYGLFFGTLVLLPLWLQQFLGYTATEAGEVLAPVGVFALILSPIVGRTIHKVDPRYYVTTAFLIFALVMWMRSQFSAQADYETLMIPTIVQGIAMSMFFVPLVTITLSGLPPDRIPAASGLSNFARITAGAFGASIGTTVWENRATLHHAQLAETIHQGSDGLNSALNTLQASGIRGDGALAVINRMVDVQSFTLAANDVFIGAAMLFLLLIPLIWLTRPERSAGASDAAAGAH